MSRGKLTALQDAVLSAFFHEPQPFFLTGGAALAGFFLKHRETSDLDLFTVNDGAVREAEGKLARIAAERDLRFEIRRSAPDFTRVALTDASEGVVVDLVRDRAPQYRASKPIIDGVRVDPLEEIFVNKINTLVSRQEERDLVDLLFIERQGLCVEDYLEAALAKDGGCTPATIAWLLATWGPQIPSDAYFAAGVAGAQLRVFMDDLTMRLRRRAHP